MSMLGRRLNLGLIAAGIVMTVLGVEETASAEPPPRVNIAGVFVDGKAVLGVGKQATYAFQVRNTGPRGQAAIGTWAEVHVPPYMTFVKTLDGHDCTYGVRRPRDVRCDLKRALDAGERATLHVVLEGKTPARESCEHRWPRRSIPGPFECLWGYAGDNAFSRRFEPNPNNNHDTYTVRVIG